MKNNPGSLPQVKPVLASVKWTPVIVFLLCLLISAIITTGAILTKSFWGDEIWSIKFATASGFDFVKTLAEDYHPPFYFILLKFWITFFGQDEITLRIFQLILGSISIFSVYLLFKKIYPKNKFHPVFILFLSSGELWLFLPMLRYYVLAAALAVISTYILFNWLDQRRKKDFYLLLASYILLLYTDYPSSVIIPVHFILLWFKKRELLKKHFLLIIISACAFIPWLIILYSQLGKLLNSEHLADLNNSPFSIILKIFYSFYAFLFSETIFPFEVIFITGIIVLLIVFIFGSKFSSYSDKNIYLFYSILTAAAGVLFTALLTTFISRHTSFIYTPSRTFFVLPFIFILISFFFEKLKNRNWQRIFIIIFLSLNLYSIYNLQANRHFLMPVYASPWKEVLNEIKGEDGIIIADESEVYKYYAEYLPGKFPVPVNPETVSDLMKVLEGKTDTSLYVLILGRESTEAAVDKNIISFIKENFTKVDEQKYLPVDESYKKIKAKILKRESYDAKFTLTKYSLK